MPQGGDLPAWIALFTGLYMLAAAVGELRGPASWRQMVGELEQSATLRFLVGIVALVIGAAIYLAVPFQPALANGDWLAVVLSAVGGIAVAKGLLILAAGDRFLSLSQRMMGEGATKWAGAAALLGGVLIFAGLARIA